MTGMFTHRDRSDYRARSNNFLLEEALYNPNSELAIVLAERLSSELEQQKFMPEESDW